jgi:hypothetical protein
MIFTGFYNPKVTPILIHPTLMKLLMMILAIIQLANHLIKMFSKLATVSPVVKVNFVMLFLKKKNKKIY